MDEDRQDGAVDGETKHEEKVDDTQSNMQRVGASGGKQEVRDGVCK